MRRRRKQFTKTVASRNALSSQEPRRRFGKKQKKKLAIIGVVFLLVCVGVSILVHNLQAKKAEAEELARKGKLIEKNADKTEYDIEGKEVVSHKDTEVHILDAGDGEAILIKKGHYEILVNAGGDKTIEYLKKHVSGDLEYFITTNKFEGNMKNADEVKKSFKVAHYIYNNIESNDGEKANGQVIDMDENLSVTVTPGIGGNDYDKTAIVTISDNDRRIFIVGSSSEKNITTLKPYKENCLAYITSGKPNAQNTPLSVLMTINPQYVIASTGTKLSADFIDNVSKLNTMLYATYKSKNIVLNIGAEEVSSNLQYEDQIGLNGNSLENTEETDGATDEQTDPENPDAESSDSESSDS